jgi:hypothetical protein
MRMDAGKISLHLGRPDVTIDEFKEALEEQLAVVREVLDQMGVSRDSVRWVIEDLHAGSAGGVFAAQVVPEYTSAAVVAAGLRAAGEGIAALEQGSKRPPYFTDRALKGAKRLSEIAQHADAKRSWFRFDDLSVSPSPHVAVNVNDIVEATDQAIGSIEGILNGVRKTDRGYSIYVKDRLTRQDVRCVVPPHLRQVVLDSFEQRVIARGVISRARDGRPQRIDVREIEPMADDSDLPTVAQVAGLLKGYDIADE